eukprot:366278-Chlamydomonas_euryale.AAC.7
MIGPWAASGSERRKAPLLCEYFFMTHAHTPSHTHTPTPKPAHTHTPFANQAATPACRGQVDQHQAWRAPHVRAYGSQPARQGALPAGRCAVCAGGVCHSHLPCQALPSAGVLTAGAWNPLTVHVP